MPILPIFFALTTPGVVIGTMIRLLFLCAGALAGVGEQAHPVGLQAVRDPHLGAVDDVVAAVLPRGRLDRRDVGARAGLGDADAGDHVAGDRRREELAASASVPKRASAGVAMSVCTPIAIGTPPQRMWPSASAITTEYE